MFDIDNITKNDLLEYLGKSYIDNNDYSSMIYDIVLYLNMIYKLLDDNTLFSISCIHSIIDNAYVISILLYKTLNRKNGGVFDIPRLKDEAF